jgi:hypothetical protein
MECDSPLMTTANKERKNPALLRDDSCLKFKNEIKHFNWKNRRR